MDQLIINPPVRLIPHWQVDPGLFVYNALVMGKGFEAFLAVIASHTALSNTAKAHYTRCQMDNSIIDTAAAKAQC